MKRSAFLLLCCLLNSPVVDAQEVKRFGSPAVKAGKDHLPTFMLQQRTSRPSSINFPTHIIRVTVDLSSKNLDCREVSHKMWDIFDQTGEGISGWGSSSCGISEEGKETFIGSAYMDPDTDEGIKNLQHFIEEFNGTDFFGTPLLIEPVKGIVVSLRVDAGTFIADEEMPERIKSLYNMKNQLYFDSLYDMDDTLFNDFLNQLSTNDPILITSFIKHWLQREDRRNSISQYLESLTKSNAVKISLKYTFLTDREPRAYVSSVTTTDFHDCRIYPSGKCLG